MVEEIVERLVLAQEARREELLLLLGDLSPEEAEHLRVAADRVRKSCVGDKVYLRGLIEFSNICVQDCLYCGIRRSNQEADRYRLDLEDILSCVDEGKRLGYRTYVLQGGEDPYYTDERIVEMVRAIKERDPECAVTLSVGEKERESYERYYQAGADRYLLRHETHSRELYEQLHPGMSYENRLRCLQDLKEIGFQVGAGFMVGLPGQTVADHVEDLLFLKELQPHMVGIGPFMPQQDTPLKDAPAGTAEMTCRLLSILRLLLPKVLLPATTALGSIDPKGREQGLQAGANVVMPNLSPTRVRDKYLLYDGKICTGDEAAHCRACIERRINSAGYVVDMGRGDGDIL
nr:[FeFe] hydrogenase H-cluster radical SAM maturase HydE [Anaerotalea alkaliphila]